MAKVCQITGKKPSRGYKYVTRGIAKKKKGIGIKVTGKTRKVFKPNLQNKRLFLPEEGRFVNIKMSANAMRTIQKQGLARVVKRLRAEGQKV